MGQVYAGFDETLKRPVALKSIRRRHAQSREMKARFLQEAQLLSRLQHPNICRIYDYIEGEDTDYLVLELIEGETLKDLHLDRLSYQDKLSIALQLAEILAAAHGAGVVHRDLKPANVMLTPEGQAKMLDFGIAQSILDEEVARFWQPSDAPTPETRADVDDTTRPTHPADPDVDPERTIRLDDVTTKMRPSIAETDRPGATRNLGEATIPADHPFRTQTGSVVGTPQSMSPEQARGERAGSAGDMYSLGLLLHELFTDVPLIRPALHASVDVGGSAGANRARHRLGSRPHHPHRAAQARLPRGPGRRPWIPRIGCAGSNRNPFASGSGDCASWAWLP